MREEELQKIMDNALEKSRGHIAFGKTADYIPELGCADRNDLGISIYTKDGKRLHSGDSDVRFTVQSISKVVSLAVALERCGFDRVFRKVGMEPSGDAFNSLVKLDLSSNYPFNPMINSGAIAVSSCLVSAVTFDEMLDITRELCLDGGIQINERVYRSEMANIARNKAIAYLLESKGILENDVERSLDFYVRMCSLNVTTDSLAGFGLALASDGIHPQTGRRMLDSDVVQTVKTIMFTCGMYDGAGEFAVRVGIPSKSGVGGGILSVVDREMGIGIYGPALDNKGNSIAGQCMLEDIAKKLKLHIFAADRYR